MKKILTILTIVLTIQIISIGFTSVNYKEVTAVTYDEPPVVKTADHIDFEEPKPKPKTKTDDEIYNEIIAGNPYKEYIYYHETSFGSPYYTIHDSVQMYNTDTNVYGICQLSLDYYDVSGYPNFYNSVYSQDEACTDYMENRYGTWENAYYFHLNNGWW